MNVQLDTPPETAVLDLQPEVVKLAIRDLDFFYGAKQALHGVSVGFAANAVTALIGPSGCGKSTLLRTINRIYSLYPGQRAEGQVLIDGEKVGETPIGNVQLAIGPHEVTFRHPELGEQRTTVTVTLNAPARVSADLRRKP